MDSSNTDNNNNKEIVLQLVIGFCVFGLYLIVDQFYYGLNNYIDAINVPVKSIYIFESMLFTYRTVFMIFGSTVAHYLNYYFVNISNYFTTTAFIILFMIRFAFLVLIYMPCTLTIHVFRIFNVEAFVFGFLQICIFAFVPHYTSIILLSNDFSRIFVFVTHISMMYFNINSLTVVRIYCWMCFFSCIFSLGLFSMYFNDFHRPKTCYDQMKSWLGLYINGSIKPCLDFMNNIFDKIENLDKLSSLEDAIENLNLINDIIVKLYRFEQIKSVNKIPDLIGQLKGVEHLECYRIVFKMIKKMGISDFESSDVGKADDKLMKLKIVEEISEKMGLLMKFLIYVPEINKRIQKLAEKVDDLKQGYSDLKIENVDKIDELLGSINRNKEDFEEAEKSIELIAETSQKPTVKPSDRPLKVKQIVEYLETIKEMPNRLLDTKKYSVVIPPKIEDIEQIEEIEEIKKGIENDICKELASLENKIINLKTFCSKLVVNMVVNSDTNELESTSSPEKTKKNLIGREKIISEIKDEIKKIIDKANKIESSGGTIKKKMKNEFHYMYIYAISPFMIFVASFFKDFLYPNVLPFSFLDGGKAHVLIKMVPFCYLIGSMEILLVDKSIKCFKGWKWYFNLVWLFTIPMLLILVFSLFSIHSRNECIKIIVRSQFVIYIMTIALIVCYSLLVCFSYVGVAYHVCYQSDIKESIPFLTCHNIMAEFFKYFFWKLSVGYCDTKDKLGYTIQHIKGRGETVLEHSIGILVIDTFKNAYKSVDKDFRRDINDYIK